MDTYTHQLEQAVMASQRILARHQEPEDGLSERETIDELARILTSESLFIAMNARGAEEHDLDLAEPGADQRARQAAAALGPTRLMRDETAVAPRYSRGSRAGISRAPLVWGLIAAIVVAIVVLLGRPLDQVSDGRVVPPSATQDSTPSSPSTTGQSSR